MELADILTGVTDQITAHPEVALLATAGGILGLAAFWGRRFVKMGR